MLSVIFTILIILKLIFLSECIGFFIIAKFYKDIEDYTKKKFLKFSKNFLYLFIILLIISATIKFVF